MTASRLALAAVVSLRAVLVYGEAETVSDAELTWAQLLPERPRLPRPWLAPPAAAPHGAELIREAPS